MTAKKTKAKRAKRWKYVSKTHEELKDLALGLCQGRVFCSTQIPNPRDIPLVFMVTGFMTKEDLAAMKKAKITMFYEEMSRALPRMINNMPMFTSANMLNETDHKRLLEINRKIQEALKEI